MPANPVPPLVLACSPRQGGNSDRAAALFAAAFAGGGAPAPQIMYLRDYQVLPCVACDACAALADKLAGKMKAAAAKNPARRPSGPEAPEAADSDPARQRPGPEAPADLGPAAACNSPGPGCDGSAAGDHGPDISCLLQSPPLLGCPLSARDKSAPLLRALALAPLVCISAPIYFYHLPAMFKGLLDRLQAFWALRQAGIELFSRPRPCALLLLGARTRGEKLFEGSLLSLRYSLAATGLEAGSPLLLYGLDAPGDLAASREAEETIMAYARQRGQEYGRAAL